MLNNIVTLKFGLEVTQGHWNGSIQKLGYGFVFAFYSNYGRIFSQLWDIQYRRMAWRWKLG